MSNIDERQGGGLILLPDELEFGTPQPLTDESQVGDMSWLKKVRTGNDQGQDGACTLFALASWATIMRKQKITDGQRLSLYRETLFNYKLPTGSGLTVKQGYDAAYYAGWLPDTYGLQPVTDLKDLNEQPILAAYTVTPAWDKRNVTFEGCLDHTKLKPNRGLHLVQIVAAGDVKGLEGKWVYIENSWGRFWGWRGLGVMRYDMHNELCVGMWKVRLTA